MLVIGRIRPSKLCISRCESSLPQLGMITGMLKVLLA